MINFWEAVFDNDLSDLSHEGPLYTWSNKQDGIKHIQERLDRYLACDNLRKISPNASVNHLGFNGSDHRPILLNLQDRPKNGIYHSGFRFEPFWLRNEQCREVV